MPEDKKVHVLTAGGAGSAGSGKKKTHRGHRGGRGKGRNNRSKSKEKNDEAGHHEEEHVDKKPAFDTEKAQNDKSPSPPPPTANDNTSEDHHLELEPSHNEDDGVIVDVDLGEPVTKSSSNENNSNNNRIGGKSNTAYSDDPTKNNNNKDPLSSQVITTPKKQHDNNLLWLFICFMGIMMSFVCYGLLLEYTTSGGRKLHELSFLFVTSGLYTLTGATGRYVRDETPTTIPPARFAVLGLTSMGSTYFSVASLRYVIYPIQVLAKSCKPVPVMLMGALMGKRYPLRKYINVVMIVLGVALFMGGGDKKKKGGDDDEKSSAGQLIGILMLFVSLCFDGGTGAYEDKLMSVYNVEPFDLMFQIQMGKTILAGIGLLVFNQVHIFIQMVQDMGFLLVALGLTGAMGQVFIFVTIAKFGALTCSIIGLARKVTTLVASIYFYGHSLNAVQFTGLAISVGSMVMNFMGKKKGGGGHHHGPPPKESHADEEMQKMLGSEEDEDGGDVELAQPTK